MVCSCALGANRAATGESPSNTACARPLNRGPLGGLDGGQNLTFVPDGEEGTLYFFRQRPTKGSSLISPLPSVETSFSLKSTRNSWKSRPAARARATSVIDVSYSLSAFGDLIRWEFQENFSTAWQLRALEHAEEIGACFDHVSKEREELEKVFFGILGP